MTEKKTQKQEPKEPKATQKKKEQPVNAKTYDAFIDLHFLKLDGATLKDSSEKEYESLKKEIEACTGHKPKIDRTCSFKDGVVKLAKGIPVPDEVYQIVKRNAKEISKYF